MQEHCCEQMADAVRFSCDEHRDQFDCPDSLIYFSSEPKVYGLIVHDGGSSYVEIHFCPWCGADLSKGK